MLKDVAEGGTIKTKAGTAQVRKIGPTLRGDDSAYAWAMLTLDINGQVAYCVAREDELARSD